MSPAPKQARWLQPFKLIKCAGGLEVPFLFLRGIVFAIALISPSLNAAVINIDFKGIRNVPGPDIQGPIYEGQSPAGNGTFWSVIVVDSRNPNGGVDLDNLTVTETYLKDSKGNQTTVAFSTSPVGGDVGGPPTTVATSFAALFSDYIFNNSAGNAAGESPFTISGLPGTTADLYFYRTSGGITIPGKVPGTFTGSGIFNSGNTVVFRDVPITEGSITGTFGSGTAVITGMTIVCPGDFNPAPVSFISEPSNQTVTEGNAVTFHAEVNNPQGVSFQWYRNGEIIPNATNASFTLNAAALSDDGLTFKVSAANVVSNLIHTVVSSNAVLLVFPDLAPPTVQRVSTLSTNQVAVLFSEPIDGTTLTHTTQFQLVLNGINLAVSRAELSPDGTTVILTTDLLVEGISYLLKIEGIKDRAKARNEMLPGEWRFQAIPYELAVVGSVSKGDLELISGRYTLSGGGSGLRSTADQFQFALQQRTGDFDMQVRIESVQGESVWAFGGLMARESLEPNSRFAAILATPSVTGSFLTSRTSAGSSSISSGAFPVNHPYTWLRMRRNGNVFTGFASIDGKHWHELGSATALMPQTVLFGLTCGSSGTNTLAKIIFQDLASTQFPNGKPQPLRFEPLAQSSRNTAIVISEIMYHPKVEDGKELEYIELFNPNPFFEDLTGYQLSGEINFEFPEGTVLEAGGFLVVAKSPRDIQDHYGITEVAGPFEKKLSNSGGVIHLQNKIGAVLLEVTYGTQYPWPYSANGLGHSLVLRKPSFGEKDAKAWSASNQIGGSPGKLDGVGADTIKSIKINEIAASMQNSSIGYLELFNGSSEPVNLIGASLNSNNDATPLFRFIEGTILPSGGFLVLGSAELGTTQLLPGQIISLVNAAGTRVVDAVEIPPQATAESSGRYPDGQDWNSRLRAQSPNQPNARPVRGGVVINEIMYHPQGQTRDGEYIEIYNRSTSAINLSGWRFADGISFVFGENTLIGPNEYLVLARNKTNLLARYPALSEKNVIGNFEGSLSRSGEKLTLFKPGTNAFGEAWIIEDSVSYRDGGRWPEWADGGGSSLELIDPRADGSSPANWSASDESAKTTTWTTIENSGPLEQGSPSFAADSLQVIMLGAGECLIDDIEVVREGSSLNLVNNPGFESGITSWSLQGNHDQSTIEQETGFNSLRSLHIRASGDGDIGANRIHTVLKSPIVAGARVTIRAKVRWLKGHPEICFRLHGNWLEAIGTMVQPENPGTPGQPNSQYLANYGPFISETGHYPIVPRANEQVTITTRVDDPDGISRVDLHYRIDPSQTFSTIPMKDDGQSSDNLAGDGIYTATLPGQIANTLIAFHITAADNFSSSASSRFPHDAPARECLVRFGDPQGPSSFGNYRVWMTQATFNRWSSREKLSNQPLDCTFVNGNHRVIYNVGGYYAGSPYKAPGYTTPNGAVCDYSLRFPEDDLFLGAKDFKIVYPGNVNGDDNTAQREQAAFWIARQMGLPANERRFVNFFVNGTKRGQIIEDAQLPNSDFIDSYFPNDSDGDLLKISLWYEFANNLSNFVPTPASLTKFMKNDGTLNIGRYRWSWRPRAVSNSSYHYASLTNLIFAANSPASEYVSRMEGLADMEQWMRTFAFEHIIGNWDSFGSVNGSNMYAYKPENGRWQMLMWDVDIAFVADGPTSDLFKTSDPVISRMFNTPQFRRAYLRALEDAANGPLQTRNIGPLLQAKYEALRQDGISVQPPSIVTTFAEARRNYILAQLNPLKSNFSINLDSDVSTTTNRISVTGTAPIRVQKIGVNGAFIPITWTSATSWSMTIPLSPGLNTFNFTGFDISGLPLPLATKSVNVFYHGTSQPASYPVRINEWMADNTLLPDEQGKWDDWFELFNMAETNINLGGFFLTDDLANKTKWQIPAETIIQAKSFLLVWADNETFQNTLGGNLHANFKLSKEGGNIALFSPAIALVDSISYAKQQENVSEGRVPDGANSIITQLVPSPRNSNVIPPLQISITNTKPMKLSWKGQVGKHYRVESSRSLSPGSWEVVSQGITAANGENSVELNAANSTATFYRVVREN